MVIVSAQQFACNSRASGKVGVHLGAEVPHKAGEKTKPLGQLGKKALGAAAVSDVEDGVLPALCQLTPTRS